MAFLPCNADDFSTTHAKAEQGDAVAQFKLGVIYEYGAIAPHRPIEKHLSEVVLELPIDSVTTPIPLAEDKLKIDQ